MSPEEAYEHYAKTGEDHFVLVKDEKSLHIVFVSNAGDVYAPALRKHYLIQNFYDGWEALLPTTTP
jgi:hypothetical protein